MTSSLSLISSEDRDGTNQALGIGMQRLIKECVDIGLFDDFTCIHDSHSIRHFCHNAEIMRDQNNRGSHLAAQVTHQVEDLRLNGYIQGCCWFICHEQFRDTSQRHRDHDTLRHTARQFMRIRFGASFRIRHADHFEQLNGALPACFLAQILMNVQYFGKLIAYFKDGIQRSLWLLKDHRDAITAHFDHFIFRYFEQVFTVQ